MMTLFPYKDTIEVKGKKKEFGGGDVELTHNNDGTIGVNCTDTYDPFAVISAEDARTLAKWILEVTEVFQ